MKQLENKDVSLVHSMIPLVSKVIDWKIYRNSFNLIILGIMHYEIECYRRTVTAFGTWIH